MKPSPKLLTLHVFFAVALAACGGGGGSSSSTASGSSGGGSGSGSSVVPDNLSDIAWMVNAATARAVTGSTAPTVTLDQAAQELAAINSNTDAVIISDILAYQGIDTEIRLPATCAGLSCTVTLPDGSTEQINLSDPEPDTGTIEYQLVMEHDGVSIGQYRYRDAKGAADQFELLSYGGWLEYSAFEVAVGSAPSIARPEVSLALSASYGDGTGSNPSSRTSSSVAYWDGPMVGVDLTPQNRGNVIHGEAKARVDFTTSIMDLRFENVADLNDPSRNSDLNRRGWDWAVLHLTNGTFSYESSQGQPVRIYLEGRFYGPNHEEVGGTFERFGVIGAFGGTRRDE